MEAVAIDPTLGYSGSRWWEEPDWHAHEFGEPSSRHYEMVPGENELAVWSAGGTITDGLPNVDWKLEEPRGHLKYEASARHGYGVYLYWSVHAVQRGTGDSVFVSGMASLEDALRIAVEHALEYERDRMLDLAMPGLA